MKENKGGKEMIRADELMVGDWVQIVSDAPTMANECHRIDWIRTGELGLDNRKIVTHPFVQPIPLTPEILEKNGFEMTKQEKWWSEWKFQPKNGGRTIFITNINCINGGYDFGCCRDGIFVDFFNIKFVHELQHALRLCGIENEIKL